jgi:hypothetical protein
MKKVLIKWIEKKNGKIIVRRFNGVLEGETEETVSFKYNKAIVTRKKTECIFF